MDDDYDDLLFYDPFLFGPYVYRVEHQEVVIEGNALVMGWLLGRSPDSHWLGSSS